MDFLFFSGVEKMKKFRKCFFFRKKKSSEILQKKFSTEVPTSFRGPSCPARASRP